MSKDPASRSKALLEGYQPKVSNSSLLRPDGTLDLSKVKPPKGGSAVQPPSSGASTPPKPPGGEKSV